MFDENMKKVLEFYNKGLALYREKKFKEGIEEFEKVLQIKPDDGPSVLYIQRCKDYIHNPPPENWDGVYVMKTK